MDKTCYEDASHAVMVLPNATKSGETFMLAQASVDRRVDVQTFSFSTLPHLITGTDRIATIHSSLAKLLAPEAELVTYPTPVPLPPLRQMLQWHGYRENDTGISWLGDVMTQAASELG